MRTGTGAIYNPTIVTAVSSIALTPVARRSSFSRNGRSKDPKERESIFKAILEKEKEKVTQTEAKSLADSLRRTIDLTV